jgi:hypothetical protein
MMRQAAPALLSLTLLVNLAGSADAGIVVTANPGSQKLVEDSNKGDIKFSVANSQTITSGGNVYTVPVLLHFVDFGAFTWVAGDPAKDDVPVNPRWKSNAESADPLSDRANVLTVYPTGKATPILNVDFLFDTLPKHDEVPTDFDTWKMPIDFIFAFPKTLAQLKSDSTGQATIPYGCSHRSPSPMRPSRPTSRWRPYCSAFPQSSGRISD